MNSLLERIRKIYNEYPRAFWMYNIIIFIDRLGGFMLYPFFALYLTQKFSIGMATRSEYLEHICDSRPHKPGNSDLPHLVG